MTVRYIVQIRVKGSYWEDFAYPSSDNAVKMFNYFKGLEDGVGNKSSFRLITQEVIMEYLAE